MKIGSHVSNKGKEMLVGAVKEAISYQANCFMIYLGAPQNSYRKNLEDFNISEFHKLLAENQIDASDVIVHAPYIVNLAQGDEKKRQYTVNFISDEILRTYAIGLKSIVLHPGASLKLNFEEGLNNIIKSLREILKNTKDTDVEILIETMSGKGTEVGFRFEHLKIIIDELNSDRINICFDTCHTFDSGYDLINDYEKILSQFDKLIGLDRIKVIHLNDSKNKLGSKKDRHQNLGFGEIGFPTLLKICEDKRFAKIPKILETPYHQEYPPYKFEIEMLRKRTFNPNLYQDIENYYQK